MVPLTVPPKTSHLYYHSLESPHMVYNDDSYLTCFLTSRFSACPRISFLKQNPVTLLLKNYQWLPIAQEAGLKFNGSTYLTGISFQHCF